MNKQKISSLLLLAILLFAAPYRAITDDFDDLLGVADFEFDEAMIDALEATENAGVSRIDAFGLSFALGRAGVTGPIWKNLKPPKGRDILYLMPHKITSIEFGGMACSLFLNATREMELTAQNTLNLDQLNIPNITDLLVGADIFPAGQDAFFTAQLSTLLPLLKKFTLREYKTGAFIQGGFNRGPFTIQLNTSMQLGLRHFWVPKQAQREIKAIVEQLFPDSPPSDASHYAYMTQAGFGDTRLKIGLNTLNTPTLTTDVGIEAIVPTNTLTTKRHRNFLPELLVLSDIDLKDAIYSSLSNIRQYLLTPELGNNGHFGLGFYLESKLDILNNLAQLWLRCSFDKFFTSSEDRLFLYQKTLSLTDVRAPNLATKVNSYIKENIFPTPLRVDVRPGGIFNCVLTTKIPLGKWAYCCGYDFYSQQQEHIMRFLNTGLTAQDVRLELSEQQAAVQHKLFSETSYTRKFRTWEATFAWGGDFTFAAHNIGKDWTLFFKVASSF